jgi:hypothetical protein
MVAFGGKRSEDSEKIIEEIRNREWGLLLMDEVMIFGKLCFSVYMKVGENPMFFFL